MIYVSVEKMMELDGWIKADGKSGDSGGGGASGGTMWVAARHFEGDKKNVIIKYCPSRIFPEGHTCLSRSEELLGSSMTYANYYHHYHYTLIVHFLIFLPYSRRTRPSHCQGRIRKL